MTVQLKGGRKVNALGYEMAMQLLRMFETDIEVLYVLYALCHPADFEKPQVPERLEDACSHLRVRTAEGTWANDVETVLKRAIKPMEGGLKVVDPAPPPRD